MCQLVSVSSHCLPGLGLILSRWHLRLTLYSFYMSSHSHVIDVPDSGPPIEAGECSSRSPLTVQLETKIENYKKFDAEYEHLENHSSMGSNHRVKREHRTAVDNIVRLTNLRRIDASILASHLDKLCSSRSLRPSARKLTIQLGVHMISMLA